MAVAAASHPQPALESVRACVTWPSMALWICETERDASSLRGRVTGCADCTSVARDECCSPARLLRPRTEPEAERRASAHAYQRSEVERVNMTVTCSSGWAVRLHLSRLVSDDKMMYNSNYCVCALVV